MPPDYIVTKLLLKVAMDAKIALDPQTQPGPLRPDCNTVVAESVLCGAVSADSPKFGGDSADCFDETSYDDDFPDDSDHDDYIEWDGCSEVFDDIDPTYYAPTDIEFMHELHGPDNCGVYCHMCQLRHQIRPYGYVAPEDGELFPAWRRIRPMNDLVSYDPGSGKIPPDV